MTRHLIRQGTGIQGILDELAADQRRTQRLQHILNQATDTTPKPSPRSTLPGDTRRLRGIPVVGANIDGASPGTRPDRNT